MTGYRHAPFALASLLALCACVGGSRSGIVSGADSQAYDDALEQRFFAPPDSARPRVWWHWMNGNITKDGIAKDLAWMKRVGIGGLQNFDASLQTPQVVDERLIYMTPEWKEAFRFAANEADRLELELAIAASPGWSETGGPWVSPADGMKKLVWSETGVDGGKAFSGRLPLPPQATGPFQGLPKAKSMEVLMGGEEGPEPPRAYGDIAVIAHPVGSWPAIPVPVVSGPSGEPVEAAPIFDADPTTTSRIGPSGDGPPVMSLHFSEPQTVRSARIYLPGAWILFAGGLVAPRLEAEIDGQWRHVADIPSGPIPTTVSFPPVTARRFRVHLPLRTEGFAVFQFDPAEGVDPSGRPNLSALGSARPVDVGEFRLLAEPRIDRFEAKAGFTIEPDYHALSQGVPEEPGIAPESVVDLTQRLRPDGSLDWTPPRGRWRVLRFGWSLVGTANHPAPPEATGLEVDKFDASAVRRYLEHYLGMYREAAGGLGGPGVDAILTDSIEVGASNWTPGMAAHFERLRGYDPTPWLPTLTGAIVGSRGQSDRFLFDFRRTLADLLVEAHYATVAEVAHEAGLTVYGEALENGRPSLGDDLAIRSHADVPMSAMWTHRRETGPRPAHVVDVKGAASVAHLYGQNLVATEALTSSAAFWDHAPAYLKRIIDLAFVNGMNRPVIHTSVHQPVDDKLPGLSLGMFGQFFNRHETWAELAKPWVDYLARNSFMLQQGRNVADVAYFYGEEAPLVSLYQFEPVPDAPTAYAYDFVNFDALVNLFGNDGNDLVVPSGARYRALYLGGTSQTMTLAALRRLFELAEGGATIVGPAPKGSPSLKDDPREYASLVRRLWPGTDTTRIGRGRVIASTDIEAALSSMDVAPDFRFAGAGEGAKIPFLHRVLDDGHSYFLVNQLDRTEEIEARFRVTGKAPELWRAETGRSEPLGYRIEDAETIVPLALRGDESVHVVFRKPARAMSRTIEKSEPVELAALSGSWTVAFQQGRGAPATVELRELAPLDESEIEGVRYFSGIAAYSTEFDAPDGWRAGEPLWLDLGEVREVAEVVVNDEVAGGVWHAPYRLDIGPMVQSGRNALEVRVANLWVNRLIGDAGAGGEKLTWTDQPTYLADAPLRRSGLIGPVKLLGK